MLITLVLVVLGVLFVGSLLFWVWGERGRLMLPSTWKSLRSGPRRDLLNLRALHMYVYGRWTKQYIKALVRQFHPRLGERGKKWWTDRYHAKVLTHEQARAIIELDHEIHRRDLEQVVPYAMARDLVLAAPPEIAAYECGCRHARNTPCQPTQVCMVVGQPFVDFVVEHHPRAARRLTQTEAVDLLREEFERGHLHSAWFKDAAQGRFYAICNCCKCCCAGIEAMVKYNSPMLASSGFVARVDESLCSACGVCVEACPFGAIAASGPARVSWEKCMGCGVCVGQCKTDAASLIRDERKGLPLDVRLMSA
jgi:ferredoxin